VEGEPFVRRARWLGHLAFLLCAATLAVNDHVLKQRHPGWWTGKLSDVVGLVVVTVLAAVVVGVRPAVVLAGVSFVALKTVPGGAELAAPVLGGVTLRDGTDLLALGVLPPTYAVLRRSQRTAGAAPSPADGHPTDRSPDPARRRRAVGAVAPVIGAVVAVAATTATSCLPDPTVEAVTSGNGVLYAAVADEASTRTWARSTDGGRTWARTDPTDALDARVPPNRGRTDRGATGAQEVCVADGTCWRLRERRAIVRIDPDGTTVVEFEPSADELSDITARCTSGQLGVLASLAAVDTAGGPEVVASFGAAGGLRRTEGGTWERVRILFTPERDASPLSTFPAKVLVVFGPLVALVFRLAGPTRWPAWRRGVTFAVSGWIATGVLAVCFASIARSEMDAATGVGRIATSGMLVTTVASFIVARRTSSDRRPAPPPLRPPPPPQGFPPPPPPPPLSGPDGA
jgi:hypothetical protein